MCQDKIKYMQYLPTLFDQFLLWRKQQHYSVLIWNESFRLKKERKKEQLVGSFLIQYSAKLASKTPNTSILNNKQI